MRLHWISIVFVFLASTSAMAGNIKTLDQVNLGDFVGTWYRVSSNPVIFEPKCRCARQILTPQPDGRVAVLNTCIKANKKTVDVSGFADALDSSGSKLVVDFGFPWKGSYWIVAFDKNLGYAVVTDKWGYSLYVMSRTPEISADLYSQIVDQLKTAQINVSRLVVQPQISCWNN